MKMQALNLQPVARCSFGTLFDVPYGTTDIPVKYNPDND